MSAIKKEIVILLHEAIATLLPNAGVEQKLIELSFQAPNEEKFGDLSSNIILRLAKEAKIAPRKLAEDILACFNEKLKNSVLKSRLEKIAIEGPGFLNFYYSIQEISQVVLEVHKLKDHFGRPSVTPKNILLEFVSANPTGPLTVAHGRQAALGNSLAIILEFCGHKVTREYYNNDEGVQINILGQSIQSRYLTEIGIENQFLENGYQGEYIRDIAKVLVERHGKSLEKEPFLFFSKFGRDFIMETIKKDLADFGVKFDNYYSQEALMKSGKVEKTLQTLKDKGFVYENEGAVWFKSTAFGDDKDRVLIKSDKSYTYLTPDIAYHKDKLERKFNFLIGILGPDHHGYIPRIKAAIQALGYDAKNVEILIAQLVTLFEGDKTLRMSTRAGEFVTLREVIDEVGKDAGKFFFLMRKFDAHLDFDLALAKTQTPENPVFYIQYAHARIESIKKLAAEKGAKINWQNTNALLSLKDPSEIRLLRLLASFENTVLQAEKNLEPYRLVPYLQELAAAFHRFYTDHRVVSEDQALTQSRLMLIDSTQTVLRIGLGLLGVSAPLKM